MKSPMKNPNNDISLMSALAVSPIVGVDVKSFSKIQEAAARPPRIRNAGVKLISTVSSMSKSCLSDSLDLDFSLACLLGELCSCWFFFWSMHACPFSARVRKSSFHAVHECFEPELLVKPDGNTVFRKDVESDRFESPCLHSVQILRYQPSADTASTEFWYYVDIIKKTERF